MKVGIVEIFLFFVVVVAVVRGGEVCQLEDHIPPSILADLTGSSNGHSATPSSIALHRNGDPNACGKLEPQSLLDSLSSTFNQDYYCPAAARDKYAFESFLTAWWAQQLAASGGTTCESLEENRSNAETVSGFLGFCDMGPDRTPPQPDTERWVPVVVPSGDNNHHGAAASSSLPCRFYTREGLRISHLAQLLKLIQDTNHNNTNHDETCTDDTTTTNELHLYAVPAGRVFMFAPHHVGEVFDLSHVQDATGNSLRLEVLSVDPRVFDIIHFFSKDESDAIIEKALRETSDTHGFHRSTTGSTGASVFARRTSENAWDTNGKVALTVKRRCFRTLGFDEYYESHTDGLQILRYNQTNAYVPHMDYLSDAAKEPYDMRSEGRGGNRFATILMYMSDMEEGAGGETVFSRARLAGDDVPTSTEVIKTMRESGELDSISPGSWEENMIGQCRTNLSVRPKKARAVLFYSQFPNGKEDPKSFHGACPVLGDHSKWACNLWVWNAARAEFPHAPFKFQPPTQGDSQHVKISATFVNSGNDPKFDKAQLYWQDQFFGDLSKGKSVNVNTYPTHVWNIKDEHGNKLQSFHINSGSLHQQYQV